MIAIKLRQWLWVSVLIWMLILPWLTAGNYSDLRRATDAELIDFAQNLAEQQLLSDWPSSPAQCQWHDDLMPVQSSGLIGKKYLKIIDKRCSPEVIYNSFPPRFPSLPTTTGYGDIVHAGQDYRLLVYAAGDMRIEQAVVSQLSRIVWSLTKVASIMFVVIGSLTAVVMTGLTLLRRRQVRDSQVVASSAASEHNVDEDVYLLASLTGDISFAGEPMYTVAEINQQLATMLQTDQINVVIASTDPALEQQTVAAPGRVMVRTLLAASRLLPDNLSLHLEVFAAPRGVAWQLNSNSPDTTTVHGMVIELALIQAATERFVGSYQRQTPHSGTARITLVFPLCKNSKDPDKSDFLPVE